MTLRVHLFPYRTQKLSSVVPKILGRRRPGKIGRCRHIYSSIAQSVERMTVNHDVTGSSPVGGAKKMGVAKLLPIFFGLPPTEARRSALKKTVRWTVFSGRGIREVFAPTRRIKRAEQRHLADTKVGGAKIRWFKSSGQRKNDNTALEKCLPVTLTFKRAVNPTLI